jgi:hypothetical protein
MSFTSDYVTNFYCDLVKNDIMSDCSIDISNIEPKKIKDLKFEYPELIFTNKKNDLLVSKIFLPPKTKVNKLSQNYEIKIKIIFKCGDNIEVLSCISPNLKILSRYKEMASNIKTYIIENKLFLGEFKNVIVVTNLV